MINKSSTKIRVDVYNKPTDSKLNVTNYVKPPMPCLTNIPSFPARRICTIVENEILKDFSFKFSYSTIVHILLARKDSIYALKNRKKH